MSRETEKDFKKFEKYVSNYKLKKLLKDDDVRREIKKLHKLYFSLLTFIAELKNYIEDDQHNSIVSKTQYAYLAEACSDIATCIFHCINGSYKSSKMMIRSSIETFLKGFCHDSLPSLVAEKSIYRIFEEVKSLKYFQQENQKKSFEVLHHTYVELCKDTHTAEEVNMQKITALKYFPTFDKKKSEGIYNILLKLIKNYLFLYCHKFNSQFHDMHYRNKEIIIKNVSKNLRPIIHGEQIKADNNR